MPPPAPSSPLAPPDPSELAFFRAIPWCAALLDAPGTVLFNPPSRLLRAHARRDHDQFFGRTLNSPDIIPACVAFFADAPLPPPRATGSESEPPAAADGDAPPAGLHPSVVTSVSMLLSLAPHALDGYPGVLHGGAQATLLDEVTGVLIQLNMQRGAGRVEGAFAAATVTASMDVRFARLARTPAVVLARAWIEQIEQRRKGRRIRLAADVRGQDGEVLVACRSTWFAMPVPKL